MLTAVERVEGTEFNTLKFKPAIQHGRGVIKVSNTLALPVERKVIEEENGKIKENYHYANDKMTVKRLRELQKYAREIEPKFRKEYKDGKYINRDNEKSSQNDIKKKKDPKVR